MFSVIGLMRVAVRVGLVDHPGGRKRHSMPVPLLGGVAIVLGCGTGLMVVPTTWPPEQTRAFIAAIGLIAIAGILDDLHEISARVKLLFQFVACALMTSWAGLSLTNLGAVLTQTPILTGAWGIPFTFLAAIGLMNAVNMLDGLDGLVGGAALITLCAMAFVSIQSYPASIYTGPILIIATCILGFLFFNLPYRGRPLRIFLCDTGALVLGLVITWFAVALSQRPVVAAPPMVFVWFCSVFLLDFICITVGRLIRRKNPLAADRRHLHHLFTRAGFSSRATLCILLFIHLLNCLIGYLFWKYGVSERTSLFFAVLELTLALIFSLYANCWIRQVRRRAQAYS